MCARSTDKQYDVVNVGTGEEHSAEEIVNTIGKLIDRKLDIEVDANRVRAVDKLHQRASTAKLNELTGSNARLSLADGLCQLLIHEGFLDEAGVPGRNE